MPLSPQPVSNRHGWGEWGKEHGCCGTFVLNWAILEVPLPVQRMGWDWESRLLGSRPSCSWGDRSEDCWAGDANTPSRVVTKGNSQPLGVSSCSSLFQPIILDAGGATCWLMHSLYITLSTPSHTHPHMHPSRHSLFDSSPPIILQRHLCTRLL